MDQGDVLPRIKTQVLALLAPLTLSLSLVGCLGGYELPLGSARAPTTSHAKDAGSQRDAKASDDDAGLHCSSDDQCMDSVRHTCDPDAHVCYECNSNSDCQERAGLPHCNPTTRACEGCTENSECRDGTQCQARVCKR